MELICACERVVNVILAAKSWPARTPIQVFVPRIGKVNNDDKQFCFFRFFTEGASGESGNLDESPHFPKQLTSEDPVEFGVETQQERPRGPWAVGPRHVTWINKLLLLSAVFPSQMYS